MSAIFYFSATADLETKAGTNIRIRIRGGIIQIKAKNTAIRGIIPIAAEFSDF